NIPHPVGANIAFFDLQRVEVLKGPQGTLYGRNTTGGAINIITRGADYNGIHGFAYGEYGNYNDWKAAGAVNIPIVQDKLAARIAYQHWNREGFGRSLVTGQRLGADRDDDLARVSLKIDPTPNFTATLKAEYFQAHRTGELFRTVFLFGPTLADTEWAAEGSPGGAGARPSVAVNNQNIYQNYSELHQFERLRGWHGVFDASWDITDYVRLRSITGVHQFTDFRVFDLDGMALQDVEVGIASNGAPSPAGTETRPLLPDQEDKQWTQEFNLTGAAFDKRFNWLVGAFLGNDKGRGNQTASVYPPVITRQTVGFGLDANFDSTLIGNNTWALFTQNDFKFNDVFSITAGARYTEEKLNQEIAFFVHSLNPALPLFICEAGPNAGGLPQAGPQGCNIHQSAKFSGTSYLLSFNFQLTPETLFYVKTARGFRGGALQVRAPATPAAAPEIAVDYEAGLKTDLFDRRLRANLAVYQTNYDNKQETAILSVNGVLFTPILNAASARIRGAEAELTAAPMRGLTLNASVGYLDASYLTYKGALTATGVPLASLPAFPNGASGFAFLQPKWSYNIGGRYVMRSVGPGDLGVSANYSWLSRIPINPINSEQITPTPVPLPPLSLVRQINGSIGLLNASLDYTIPDKGLTVSLFSTNLLNKKYQRYSLTFASPAYGFTADPGEPRMYGISIRKAFGNE
ncbi:MAG: hypothetical protein JWQ97_2476, partial [Phenylobacterium sp.]|nr:hypothetical protein [Phenylobacterium sp.]